jgi:hypothetical protein
MCQFINHNNVYGSKVVTHTMKKESKFMVATMIRVKVPKIFIGS